MYKVVVQARHVHLSPADQACLFGPDANLTPLRGIGHVGQVVYLESLTLVGANGTIEQVRIIGPNRQHTQVEISEMDAAAAGIDAPVRLSGDCQFAGSGRLLGPAGECRVDNIIIPARHLHLPDHLATEQGLRHHQRVRLLAEPAHQVVREVVVRVHPTFAPELHLTSDEAAVHWLESGDLVKLA